MCSIQTMVTPVCAQLADLFQEVEHLGFGQTAGDLVEKQDLGVGGQGPGQLEPLAVEKGQRARERR